MGDHGRRALPVAWASRSTRRRCAPPPTCTIRRWSRRSTTPRWCSSRAAIPPTSPRCSRARRSGAGCRNGSPMVAPPTRAAPRGGVPVRPDVRLGDRRCRAHLGARARLLPAGALRPALGHGRHLDPRRPGVHPGRGARRRAPDRARRADRDGRGRRDLAGVGRRPRRPVPRRGVGGGAPRRRIVHARRCRRPGGTSPGSIGDMPAAREPTLSRTDPIGQRAPEVIRILRTPTPARPSRSTSPTRSRS